MKVQRRTTRGVAAAVALLVGASLLASSPALADNQAPAENGAVAAELDLPPLDIEPAGQLALTGNLNLHDPTIWKAGDTYYAAPSHRGVWSAPALEGPWTNIGSVPGSDWAGNGLWAPHAQQIGDTTYFYYSNSAFGTNNSAIGLKTTQTPGDPSSYVDHGAPIVTSGNRSPENNTFNAIDPSIEQDDEGNWWLLWGSHFDGMFIQQLDDDMVTLLGEPRLVATRASERFPVDNPNFNRMEGPSVFKHGEWFYLLTAWDWCCRASGNDNTYKIVAGRSKNIDGPYVDKNGVDLAEGGGTIILNSRVAQDGVTPSGLYRSPGAPDYFWDDGTLYLVYHAHRPGTVMGIRPFNWDDGWPFFYEPGGGDYDITDGATYQLRLQAGHISDPDSLQNPTASSFCLDASGGELLHAGCADTAAQDWTLERYGDGFYGWRSNDGDGEQCLTMTSLSGEVGTPVGLAPCDLSDGQHWYFDDTGHGFHRLVGKTSNLALEVANTNGDLETGIVGGYRRDGDHQAGNLTQAAKWPPQQWRLEMQAEPELDVEVSVSNRCVVGRNVLTVRAQNTAGVPVDLHVESDFGEKSHSAVQPDRSVLHAFSVRSPQMAASETTVTASAVIGGSTVSTSHVVEYSASSCG